MDGRTNRIPPFSVVLIMVALSLIGVASLRCLNIQYTPTAEERTLTVSFNYPNASAETVEAEATSKLEGVLSGLDHVSGVSSTSSKVGGTIQVSFNKGTDMDAARFEAASAVRNIRSSLPREITYPTISRGSGESVSRVSYLVKGDIPSREISRYLNEHVLSPLAAVPGVDKVEIGGGVPFHWVITFDATKAASAGITADEIASAFRSYYGSEIVGMARTGDGMMSVRLEEESGPDFGAVPVKNVGGEIIHLRDIATWRHEESLPTYYYRVNGLNTITMTAEIASSANLLTTAAAVRAMMTELRRGFPGEITASVAYDSSEYVQSELNRIYLRTGLCVLILLLFVFIIYRSWRYMMIILSTLAVNILTALAIYSFAGLQIHIYTLAGITVSLGIIIDTSIVMIDHYSRYRDRKVFPAILSAVATTVGALLMVLLLPESEKANLVDFIWVIVINLCLSLLISYLFIPSLMEYIPVKAGDRSGSVRGKRRTVRRNRMYSRYIGWGVRHRWVYIVLFIAAFGLPFRALPKPLLENEKTTASRFRKAVDKFVTWKPYESNRVKIDKYAGSSFALFYSALDRFNFYRQPQKKRLSISAGMLEGCTVNQLNEVVKAMENYLSKFDEISVFTTRISSYNDANITVEFKPEYENTSFPSTLKSEVTRMAINFGGANWRVWGIDDNSFNNNIVSSYKSDGIILRGYNYQRLHDYASMVVEYVSGNRRVQEPEIWGGGRYGRPSSEFVLDYDFGRMTMADVNPYSYFGTLSSLLYEEVIGKADHDGELSDVVLRSSDLDSYDLWHVVNSPVEIGESKVTLSGLGSIDKRRTGLEIQKENQSYTLEVRYDFIGSYELSRRLREQVVDHFNNEILPVGFKAEDPSGGWFYGNKERYAWLIFLIIAVIYVMLAMTFESFRYPLPVIFMIPISFIGLFLVFGLSDFAFDQGGFAAFVMLCGIVVNAGIYLVTTYQETRDYIKAFSRKITPISLTIVSTILGLLPFLSDGPEEVFWFDFAIGTIAGMAFSVIAIIFVLPVFCVRK
ncbi:MAG: efflux RND transporter permease subunit, partial [Bacteroidales bacterium]|nr:efflux RND transporter permease subunit [Bacteroidales bacterium]